MKKNYNLPNLFSTFRIFLVPAFIVAFFLIKDTPNYVAFGIFMLASLTDILDGFVARRFNMITNLGKVLDPLADKLLKISVFTCFIITGDLSFWVFAVILILDLSLIIAGTILLKREIIIASNNFGKAGTLIITIGVILTFFNTLIYGINLYIIYIGLFIMLLSVLSYAHIYLKIKRQKNITLK